MKVSEWIERFQSLINEHGDMDVVFRATDTGWSELFEDDVQSRYVYEECDDEEDEYFEIVLDFRHKNNIINKKTGGKVFHG